MNPKVILKSRISDRVLKGHPWIYNNEIASVAKGTPDGATVDVYNSNGNFIGRGYYNSKSQIEVRLLTRNQNEEINEDFFLQKIGACWAYRKKLGYIENCRLVFGEADGLPSLIIDKFNDYIYQADTDEEEDGLPVMVWSQQDADFIGGEIELSYNVEPNRFGHWRFSGFGDIVEGKLSNNSNVPLQPPARVGMEADWDYQGLAANVTWIHAYKQDNTAAFETDTPGYDLLNSELVYSMPGSGEIDWQVYIQGQNLLDEDVRNSASSLKDHAPQIGRNVILGVRMYF